jgi:acetyl-CoA acetyltransferase
MPAFVLGIGETPRLRHWPAGLSTLDILKEATQLALSDAGLKPRDIDGFALASFTADPDRAIDVAWRLGLSVNWLVQDTNGGAAGLNLLSHALAGLGQGAASRILLVAGDITSREAFHHRVTNYNSATRDHLTPLGYTGPGALFAMLTKRQMRKHDLVRTDYGHLAIAQRQHAAGNPLAAYRAPLTMDEYLNAPMVAEPLGRYDCVPTVAGASAIVIGADPVRETAASVQVLGLRQTFNYDHQEGDGLRTGIHLIAGQLWNDAGVRPADVDVASVYDDYPAMAYAQLSDLGLIPDGDIARFAREVIARHAFPVNTGGGLLSGGQPGCASGLHGIVEVARQLLARGGDRQVPHARIGVASGYGMALYRYCACAGAVVLARTNASS